MALAPRLPTPNSDSKLQSSIGKDEYFSEIVSIQKQIPYERAIGKFNPYTNRKIEGPNDYAFYCHCYALCRLYETNMQTVRERADFEIKSLRAKNESLQANQQSLKSALANCEDQKGTAIDEAKRYHRLTRIVLFVSIVLIVSILAFLLPQFKNSSKAHVKPSSSSSSSASGSSTPTAAPAPSHSGPGARPNGYASTQYIGNKHTKKFHYSSCGYLPDKSNQVVFDSRSDAVDSGYTPCGRCNP